MQFNLHFKLLIIWVHVFCDIELQGMNCCCHWLETIYIYITYFSSYILFLPPWGKIVHVYTLKAQ